MAISTNKILYNDEWYNDINLHTSEKYNTYKIDKPYLDKNFGYLLGMYLSDGTIQNNKKCARLDISKPDINIKNKLCEYLINIGLSPKVVDGGIYLHSRIFIELLDSMGFHAGTTSHYKRIPPNILYSNYDFRVGLLNGLFDGDGSVGCKKYVYTSINYDLLNDVKMLLKGFGVVSYIDKRNQLFVTGNNAITLSKILDLNHVNKSCKNNINKCYEYGRTNNDVVSFTKNGYKHKKGAITTRHLAVDKYDSNMISMDIFYDKVISVEPSNDVIMFDIEVEDDHSFVANGIIVHNCQGQTLDKIHLDLGAGCFETGQLYVALSRCRSLEGITLSRMLKYDDVKVDNSITSFYDDCRNGVRSFTKTKVEFDE